MIKFSVYFKNHLNKNIKIDDNIVNIEDGIFEISNQKIYNTLTFVTNGIYYSPDIIGDNLERIKIKYQIDDKINEEFFIIEEIEFLDDDNIKVYAKSITYKYTKQTLNKIIKANSIQELIFKLFRYEPLSEFEIPEVKINCNFENIPLIFDYVIENKTPQEVITEITKITGLDYYFYKGELYFEDKKVINIDDEPIKEFNEIEDILDLSTSQTNNPLNKVYINEIDEHRVIAKPELEMEIDTQKVAPDKVINLGDRVIAPQTANYKVYFSPITKTPTFNRSYKKVLKKITQTFEVPDTWYYLKLKGGIKEIIDIKGVKNYTYEKGFNIIVFEREDDEITITYTTYVLVGRVPSYSSTRTIKFLISHFNRYIDYDHKIEVDPNYYSPDDENELSKLWIIEELGKYCNDLEEILSYPRYITISIKAINEVVEDTKGNLWKNLELFFMVDMKNRNIMRSERVTHFVNQTWNNGLPYGSFNVTIEAFDVYFFHFAGSINKAILTIECTLHKYVNFNQGCVTSLGDKE